MQHPSSLLHALTLEVLAVTGNQFSLLTVNSERFTPKDQTRVQKECAIHINFNDVYTESISS